jgi:hypothetical protein
MICFKVNGIDLDIPTDLKLSFKKKNILFSFNDIELNRSQGFVLPHSKVNDSFFDFSYRPDFDGGVLRVSHEATMFYSGGAERGILSCKSVSPAGYDCVFVYGELQKLKQIKEAGNIATYYQPNDYVMWGDATEPAWASDQDAISDYLRILLYVNDVPSASVCQGINLLPSVRIDRMITDCAALQGVNVTMPAEPLQPRIILSTTNGVGAEVTINYVRNNTNLTISPAIDGAEVGNLSFMCWDVFYIFFAPVKIKTTKKCKGIRFSRKIEVEFKSEVAISTNKIPFAIVVAGQRMLFEAGDYFTFINKDCTLFPFGGIHYPFGGQPNIAFGLSAFLFNYSSFLGVRQQDNIKYNVDYYLKDNLPEVTLIDLFQLYAHTYNSLLYYDVETNTVSFFDGNFTSEPVPLDNKLIKIEKITRTIGTYAQKNKVEFNSEDYVKPEWKYKFSYDIANENLDKEKVITKIPFSEGNGEPLGNVNFVKPSDIVNKGNDWSVVAKKPTIAIAGRLPFMERFMQLAPRNAVNDIFDLSTTIEVSVTMYLFEFQNIKPKTTFSLYGKVYAYFSGTWSDNIAKLVLIKIK